MNNGGLNIDIEAEFKGYFSGYRQRFIRKAVNPDLLAGQHHIQGETRLDKQVVVKLPDISPFDREEGTDGASFFIEIFMADHVVPDTDAGADGETVEVLAEAVLDGKGKGVGVIFIKVPGPDQGVRYAQWTMLSRILNWSMPNQGCMDKPNSRSTALTMVGKRSG